MPKTTTLTVRVNPTLKSQTEKVLHELDMTTSQAITLFFEQIVHDQNFPFEVDLGDEPNEETIRAIEDATHGRNLTRVENVDELFEILKLNK